MLVDLHFPKDHTIDVTESKHRKQTSCPTGGPSEARTHSEMRRMARKSVYHINELRRLYEPTAKREEWL